MSATAVAQVTARGCTNFKLRQVSRRVSQRYDQELAKAGIKTTQYSLLTHLVKLGPIRPGDLAQAMTMDASTLTRNVKPLVAAGWVELGAGADGRSRLVGLTAAGREKWTESRRHWRVAQASLNQLLGADRVQALHVLIDESLSLLATLPNSEDVDD
jgi:DNA-binding MarR family transcriptional regulator